MRPSRITIPPKAHPLVKFIFAEMKRQRVTYVELSEMTGLARETITAWRTRNKPDPDSIEAALAALGYGLVPVPLPVQSHHRRRRGAPTPGAEVLRDILARQGWGMHRLRVRSAATDSEQYALF